MMGKYLNGYEPTADGPPPGWDEWAVAGNGYRGFNYDLNQTGRVVHYGNAAGDYMTDVLSNLGQAFVRKAAGQPFFLEIATFAPHGPYVPAPRDASAFPGLAAPRNAAFGARPDDAAPEWLRAIPPLSPNELRNIDRAYRLRAQAVQAIDKMIGDLRTLLAASGEAENTYIVFSSDNGYHMGEYSLSPGKMTAYDTDIHVPLVIVGPGIPPGAVARNFALNVDLAATFADLAGASAPLAPDGRSLVPLFAGQPVADWRQAALVEHLRPARFDDNDPDMPGAAANPTTYAALRTATALYVEYASGEVSYYDLARDPFALKNVAASLAAAEKTRLHNQLYAFVQCRGATACWEAGRLTVAATAPVGPAVPVGIAPGGRRGAGPSPGERPNRPFPNRQAPVR
jgi:arylsulfatase A-like enzyme